MRISATYILPLLLLLISSHFLQVARSQSESGDAGVIDESELGTVGDDAQEYGDVSFSPAPGVETACIFPKNPSRLIAAGEESELLVALKNDAGESSVNVIMVKASVHLSYDHRLLVQNLTAQAFNNATVPPSTQAAFPYIFAVSKYLQSGTFDLVGTIYYEIDHRAYQSTFFNGTIEVTEASGLLSGESVLLVFLGIILFGILLLWIRTQIKHHLSKKSKRGLKVEVGTKTNDGSLDEWLQGTAFTQSQSSKSKKKK